jgi:ADP-heptose:LPS heptosyltransferase
MNRHIKKYFFYIWGRFLEALGKPDQALHFYAEVIRIRTFFIDVQTRYQNVFKKSSQQCTFELHGGVGDFLQHLPFLLKHKHAHYVVITHFPRAKSFFKNLGINIQHYHFYQLREEHHLIKENLKRNINSYPAPRQIFFDAFPFVSTEKKLDHDPLTSVIGLHMTPSAMTSNPLSRDFIDQLIHKLLSYQIRLVLFGTQAELNHFEFQKDDRISFASHKNIIENLAQVKSCDVMIGADSVFKTMSSMAKIPTIIFYEDVKSHFRDRVFIDPYVRKKIMFTYKYAYQSLEGPKIEIAIDFIMNILKDRLKLI